MARPRGGRWWVRSALAVALTAAGCDTFTTRPEDVAGMDAAAYQQRAAAEAGTKPDAAADATVQDAGLACAVGFVSCRELCIDPGSDRAHCGASAGCGEGDAGTAGTACLAGHLCVNGSCQLSCQPGAIACDGVCLDPRTSRAFCGATDGCGAVAGSSRGVVCPAEQVCGAGTCRVDCPAGLVLCGGACVDALSNRQHCGATAGCGENGTGTPGVACDAGELCSAGTCRGTCAQGLVACGGLCVDPETSRTHCGATAGCGTSGGNAGLVCPEGQLCNGRGACEVLCPGGLLACAGACINPQTSRSYCGAMPGCGEGDAGAGTAGATCSVGQVCAGGRCELTCPTPLVVCAGTCTDPETSRAHCGATVGCGESGGSAGALCGPAELCSGGSCSVPCAAPRLTCAGQCVDPGSDPQFCGASSTCSGPNAGRVCAPGDVCLAGACVAVFPSSCAELRLVSPSAPDGEYTLHFDNHPEQPFRAYCDRMATAPGTYLTLVRTGEGENVSRFPTGGLSSGTDVVTRWSRVRFDPATATVVTHDYTFATSTGAASHDATFRVPFGVARDCAGGKGSANIDFRGLPFALDAAATVWFAAGVAPVGQATPSASGRVVNITGGGSCGSMAPGSSPATADPLGGATVRLVYRAPAVCTPTTCSGHGVCSAGTGDAECLCALPYVGSACAECAAGFQDNDRDGVCAPTCGEATCSGHGACTDSAGVASCSCFPGYVGVGCGACALGYQDNDANGSCLPACGALTCPANASCTEASGVAQCTCLPGYAGANCAACAPGYQDNDTNGSCLPACVAASCSGHGACADASGSVTCACTSSYVGPECAACADGFQDADGDGFCLAECPTAFACSSHGACSSVTGSAVCACGAGYAGVTCEGCARGFQDNDADGTCTAECNGASCSGRGTCSDASGQPSCTCAPGYDGTDCSACVDGFQDTDLNGTCLPECEVGTCSGRGTCGYLAGTATCSCEPGAAGSRCEGCAPGYQDHDGNGSCAVSCSAATCSGRGTCTDGTGAVSCSCAEGYQGATCAACAAGFQDSDANGSCLPTCAFGQCAPGGSCTLQAGAATCVCAAGYAGATCASCASGYQDANLNGTCEPACASGTCSGHGLCGYLAGRVDCSCAPEYGGAACEQCALGYQDTDGNGSCFIACSAGTCSGHGVCGYAGGLPSCACDSGWSGPNCSDQGAPPP